MSAIGRTILYWLYMNLFQTKEWGEFKLKTGYEASERLDDLLILIKKLPFSKAMMYSPLVDKELYDQIILNSQWPVKSQDIGRKNGSIFWRLELLETLNENDDSTVKWLEKSGFIKAFEEMQPEHTILIDLKKIGRAHV